MKDSVRSVQEENIEYSKSENLKDKISKRRKSKESQPNSFMALCDSFKLVCSDGCNYVCACCDQLWFKTSVVPITRIVSIDSKINSICITMPGIESQWVCVTCVTALKRNKPQNVQSLMDLNFLLSRQSYV